MREQAHSIREGNVDSGAKEGSCKRCRPRPRSGGAQYSKLKTYHADLDMHILWWITLHTGCMYQPTVSWDLTLYILTNNHT